MRDGPAFRGGVFGAGNEADAIDGRSEMGNERGTIRSAGESEMTQEIFPQFELVARTFIEVGGDSISVCQ